MVKARQLESNISKLGWINVFFSAQFQAVVATIYLLSKGFNLAQVLLLGSFYAVAAMLSEIPTGMFSDQMGRKNSLIFSTVLDILAVITVILTNSFWVVAAMYAVSGVAASFSSGTDTAILYDTLCDLNRGDSFKKISGHIKWLGAWGGAIGGILGGIIAKSDLSYAWWAWVVALVAVLLIKMTLVEPSANKNDPERMKLWAHFTKSVQQSLKGEANYFIFYYVFIWLFFWLGYSLWQPYLKFINLPVAYFGFFYAGVSLLSGLASRQAHTIEKRIGMRASLLLMPIMLVVAFLLEARYVFVFSFLFITLQAIAGGYFGPVLDDYVNTRVPSHIRATVLSVQNMFSRLAFAIVSPIIGYFIDLYSLTTAFYLMGAALAVIALGFYFSFNDQPKVRPCHA